MFFTSLSLCAFHISLTVNCQEHRHQWCFEQLFSSNFFLTRSKENKSGSWRRVRLVLTSSWHDSSCAPSGVQTSWTPCRSSCRRRPWCRTTPFGAPPSGEIAGSEGQTHLRTLNRLNSAVSGGSKGGGEDKKWTNEALLTGSKGKQTLWGYVQWVGGLTSSFSCSMIWDLRLAMRENLLLHTGQVKSEVVCVDLWRVRLNSTLNVCEHWSHRWGCNRGRTNLTTSEQKHKLALMSSSAIRCCCESSLVETASPTDSGSIPPTETAPCAGNLDSRCAVASALWEKSAFQAASAWKGQKQERNTAVIKRGRMLADSGEMISQEAEMAPELNSVSIRRAAWLYFRLLCECGESWEQHRDDWLLLRVAEPELLRPWGGRLHKWRQRP